MKPELEVVVFMGCSFFDGGGYPPHSWMNLKTKGLQNGFLYVHEKKREIFAEMREGVSSKMGTRDKKAAAGGDIVDQPRLMLP